MPLPTENQITALQKVANIGLTYPELLKEIRDNRTAASVILTGQSVLSANQADTSETNYTGAILIFGGLVLIGLFIGFLFWRK